MNRATATIIINALLIATAILTVVPLLWMISASFMPTGEATIFPPRLFPTQPTITHNRELFTRMNFGRTFANSMIIAIAITLFSLLLNSMAGYAFAKLRFGGRDRLFGALVAALVIHTQVGMLPLFLVQKRVHLVNSYWGVILPSMATIFGIFLIRQFMLSIPDDLLDAARIDGAGEFRIYWSIVMPLARPVLVTLAIFAFMSAWNDFMWPLIVLTDAGKYTLPVAVANLVGEHVQDTELMMASSVLTVLPVLILFLALQRHYIAGIMVGGVKG